MLSLRTGSFRSLEDELCARLRARPPLEAAIVVVPSSHIKRRLQRALAAAGGVANVRLLNFHALALAVLDEAGVGTLPVVEEHGEEELFRAFLREPGAPERYRKLADRPGAAALLGTVRDLRGAVLAAPLLREVKEELPEDAQRLAELARLVELYAEFLKRTGFTTRAGIAGLARGRVAEARFVLDTRTWAVYGFYEFTGEEKDLLDEIVGATDVTAYVPYRAGPAYAFVEKTLNADFGAAKARQGGFIAGAGPGVDMKELRTQPPRTREDKKPVHTGPPTLPFRATAFTARLFDPEEKSHKGDAPVPAVSVAGTADELWYAIKEARRVRESEGVAWRDIAILCRNLEGRLTLAARYFREEGVPWTTTASTPLASRPLAQAAALATRLLLEDAWHLDVMEWFGSSLVKDEARPEQWRAIAAALGIVSGNDWRRLEAARGADLVDVQGDTVAAAAVVDAFADAFDALRQKLPGAGLKGWRELATAWEAFYEAKLHVTRDEAAWQALRGLLHDLASLEVAAAPPGPQGFAAAFVRALNGTRFPAHAQPADGVALLDAMTARGQRFRVAVLVGLNEHEWPAVSREDPFLPDASRRRIAETTGCRLPAKMDRISEERLLYAFALDAAERVMLMYRRTDDDGRREAPSSFLDETRRVVPIEDKPGVPRLPVKKFERKLGWLTWNEQRMHALLTGTMDADPAIVKAYATSNVWDSWTQFDVLGAPPAQHIEKVAERGMSPSGLQDLATCPFKYWARRVIGVEALDPREAEEDIAALEVGQVLHEALADRSGADTLALAREIFRRRADRRPPLRWAVWEAARDAGLRALTALVVQDKAELAANGWSILGTEVALGPIPGPGGIPRFMGRVDRIETRAGKTGVEFRVTDFKYKMSREAPSAEKSEEKVEADVLRDAARGIRLQLPAYAALVQAQQGQAATFAGAHYYYFGPRFNPVRRGLSMDAGAGVLEEVAARSWQALSKGWFVPVDDIEVCRNCDVRAICRRNHFPTRKRSIADPQFKTYIDGRLA